MVEDISNGFEDVEKLKNSPERIEALMKLKEKRGGDEIKSSQNREETEGGKELRAKELAGHEIKWWQFHHRKEIREMKECMAKGLALQYSISFEKAMAAAELKCEAIKHHDEAEKIEDEIKNIENTEEKEKKTEQANNYWKKAEECLYKYFLILEGAE